MKQYVCFVCGYVHIGDLPDDFVCPLCGAGRDAFRLKEEAPTAAREKLEKPHTQKELSPMEMSIVCSNLARGCEKQYMPVESENFKKLAEFFRSKVELADQTEPAAMLRLIETDLSVGFPYGNAVAKDKSDRGALRAQVWAEKVTRMQNSLLSRYQEQGDRMLVNTGGVCLHNLRIYPYR